VVGSKDFALTQSISLNLAHELEKKTPECEKITGVRGTKWLGNKTSLSPRPAGGNIVPKDGHIFVINAHIPRRRDRVTAKAKGSVKHKTIEGEGDAAFYWVRG